MGLFFSCCRRQKPQPEREPLLPKTRVEAEPPRYDEILADIIAAVNAGKLPSQAQLGYAAFIILNSQILNIEDSRFSGRQPASHTSWRRVLKDIRDVIEASVEIGLQKNADDRIQEVIFLSKGISSDSAHASFTVDITDADHLGVSSAASAASNIPLTSEIKADAEELAVSIQNLFILVIKSSAFRFLLQDVLVSARHILADTAAVVGHTAGQVQIAAEKIQHIVEPDHDKVPTRENVGAAINEAGQNSADAFVNFQNGIAQDTRAVVINRIQEVVSRAHSSPEYKRAIQTILLLFRKYRKRLDQIASAAKEDITNLEEVEIHVEPKVWTDDDLTLILRHVKCLLERFASNHSLDPLLNLFSTLMDDITGSLFDPELESYLADLGKWLDQALKDSDYALSSVGKVKMESLFDRGKALTAEETKFGKEIRELFDALDSFLDALKSDRSSRKWMDSVDALSHDVTSLYQNYPAQLIEELKRDAFGWFLPRILRLLRAVPMPRIEFVSKTLEVVVDALFLTTTSAVTSLMPDHIRLESRSELHMDVSEEDTVQKDRFRIHVDGLRLAAKDLGYYVRYKGTILGYEDEGLLSIIIGSKAGQGLNFDADVEMDIDVGNENVGALFLTRDVRASVSGLRFSISRSKHPIINMLFIQPFAGPIVRKVFENVVSHYIRTRLDAFAQMAADVQKEAKAFMPNGSSPTLEDYWRALLRQWDSSEEENEGAPSATIVDSQPTMTGVVQTTLERTESSAPHSQSGTVLAIGIGPQILPDKGVVALEENPAAEVARDALNQVEVAVEHIQGEARQVVGEVGEDLNRRRVRGITERIARRKKEERRTAGWRSAAFDLQRFGVQ